MPKTKKVTKKVPKTRAKSTAAQSAVISRGEPARGWLKPIMYIATFVLVGLGTLVFVSAATTTYSFWGNNVPKTITNNNSRSVELGLRFKSGVAGYVTGVRFYKGAQNTGTHTGSLWSSDGRQLATTTFTKETASGWQTAQFAKPVSIAANVTYVISYHAPKGMYSSDSGYFAKGAYVKQKLTAPKDNGVYIFSTAKSVFPKSVYGNTNYWVDVVFSTKLVSAPAAPAAPSNVVANLQGTTSVSLSWKASTSANPIANYQVYRSGTKVATITTTSYTDTGLTAGKSYDYTVTATDTKGATSAASAKVSITIPAASGGSTGGGGSSNPGSGATTLFDASKKEIAMQLVSSAENSTLNWKAQYGYIEDIKDGRGYTGGIIGFCSGCSDMAKVVGVYNTLKPGNVLSKYYNTLVSLGNAESASHTGLDPNFTKDWKTAATDPLFQQAQNSERDRVYFNPSVNQAITDGLHPLGQFIYYDAMVMHGPGSDPVSFGGIRAAALKKAKTPAQGGNETTYLNAFLDARKAAMLTEEAHSDTDRVDTEQRVFLKAGNLNLNIPLNWTVYGDSYSIAKAP
ncbi:MAG TPA: chitosanase [Candidatus Saccharimonadales bacterium]|nr:chitosanase [Candidatus Saccharimonadales bacterium]